MNRHAACTEQSMLILRRAGMHSRSTENSTSFIKGIKVYMESGGERSLSNLQGGNEMHYQSVDVGWSWHPPRTPVPASPPLCSSPWCLTEAGTGSHDTVTQRPRSIFNQLIESANSRIKYQHLDVLADRSTCPRPLKIAQQPTSSFRAGSSSKPPLKIARNPVLIIGMLRRRRRASEARNLVLIFGMP